DADAEIEEEKENTDGQKRRGASVTCNSSTPLRPASQPLEALVEREGHDPGDHAVHDSRTRVSCVFPGAMLRRIAAPPYPTERCRGIRDRCNGRPDRRRAPAARTRRVRNRSERPPATGGHATAEAQASGGPRGGCGGIAGLGTSGSSSRGTIQTCVQCGRRAQRGAVSVALNDVV